MLNSFHNSKLYMQLVMSVDLAASLIFMHVTSTVELLSRTSMCTAQSSSLSGNKLVHSRNFCPRAVARGLAEEEKVKGRGGGRYEFS
jgi:hypothetical protein